MDGDLDPFIRSYLMAKKNKGKLDISARRRKPTCHNQSRGVLGMRRTKQFRSLNFCN